MTTASVAVVTATAWRTAGSARVSLLVAHDLFALLSLALVKRVARIVNVVAVIVGYVGVDHLAPYLFVDLQSMREDGIERASWLLGGALGLLGWRGAGLVFACLQLLGLEEALFEGVQHLDRLKAEDNTGSNVS